MIAISRTSPIANASPFCEARELMKKLEDELSAADAMHATHDAIERMVVTEGNKILRAMLQQHYDLRASLERDVAVKAHDRHRRERLRQSIRKLETLVGEVEVQRTLYQAEGVPGVPYLAPLEGVLAMPSEKYSHEVRRLVAEESAKSSFDEVVELIAQRTGASVPKRQVEELTILSAQDFDAFYGDRLCEVEDTDHLMVLSFDGKGIAMRLADLREATRKKAEAARANRTRTRLASGEKPNAKRMAEVAAVYSLQQWPRTLDDVLHGLRTKATEDKRPRPTSKRVWASVEHSPQRVIDDAFDEAFRRDPELRRQWVVLVDGNRDQLRRIQRAAQRVGVEIRIVLDIVHVLEYLWHAAYAFVAAGTGEAETWVENRLHALLTGHSAAALGTSLRGMIERHKLTAKTAKPVNKCIKYLARNAAWLHYDRALAEGLPIATGVIEGACRHLVQDRMGRTGARWSLAGAEAVLRLRALRSSGDFDDYWLFHLAKEHERNHSSRYADGVVPDPIPKPRGHLRIVK